MECLRAIRLTAPPLPLMPCNPCHEQDLHLNLNGWFSEWWKPVILTAKNKTMAAAFKPPGQCPACGEWIPRKAVACDCCGACELSGWKGDAEVYDGVDLPEDDDFDYDDFIAREFGSGKAKKKPMSTVWWITAAVLLAIMVYSAIRPLWH
jgi:hypothetical protein